MLRETIRGLGMLAVGMALFSGTATPKPFIFLRGVVNAGSLAPKGVPAGAIARGSIFTIFGKEMGPTAPAQVTEFPLGDNFQGVEIEITQGEVTVNAIPIFVFAGQINAIMPSDAPLGDVLVRVIFNGDRSNSMAIVVVQHNVGIFTATGAGAGPGAIQNFVSASVQPLNSLLQSATPGQVVILWATGLGPIEAADNGQPPVGNLPFEIEVFVGGEPVQQLSYGGRAPCCAGVDQLVFPVPEDAPEGCYVPVRIRVAGKSVSNTVTMAINRNGGRCTEEGNPFLDTLIDGGKVGVVVLLRDVLNEDILQNAAYTIDKASAYFREEPGGQFAFNPLFAFPPEGSCTSYSVSGDMLRGYTVPFVPQGALGAGPITFTGPGGVATIAGPTEPPAADYGTPTVGGPQGTPDHNEPLLLSPGDYATTSPGDTDLPAVNTSIEAGGGVVWSNRDEFNSVQKGKPMTFRWSGPAESRVALAGVGVDRRTNSSTLMICVAESGTNSFTIPADALANLPASRRIVNQSSSYMILGSLPAGGPSLFDLVGLDVGGALFRHMELKSVRVLEEVQ